MPPIKRSLGPLERENLYASVEVPIRKILELPENIDFNFKKVNINSLTIKISNKKEEREYDVTLDFDSNLIDIN